MESVAVSAYLIVYAINCGTFLVFFKESVTYLILLLSHIP
jgi:hypothetical protein